jgi:hypothetical protein
MPLPQNFQNLRPQENFQLIRECLHETNKFGKEKFVHEFTQQQVSLAPLKKALFFHPNIISMVVFIISLILLIISLIIPNFIFMKIFWIRLTFFIIISFFYLAIPIFLERITPKFDMDWDERWGRVLSGYLSKTGLSLKQTERNIKRAILYYSRKSQPIGFINNLLWSGIFVGCLPERDFQNALITMSVPEILNANFFGAVCIIILPVVYVYYFVNYKIPIAWMENVVAQIELESMMLR